MKILKIKSWCSIEYKNRIEYQLGYRMIMDEEFNSGEKKGLQKGLQKGEHNKTITIAKYSGLSEEEIEKL